MTSYVLIVTIIHGSIGAVDVQRMTNFDTYADCATHAMALTEPLKPLYPDSTIKWECQKE